MKRDPMEYAERKSGFGILTDELIKEAKREELRALLSTDYREQLEHEVMSLEIKKAIRGIIDQQKDTTAKGLLANELRKMAKIYELRAELTDDPEEKAQFKEIAKMRKRAAKEIGG